MKNIHKHVATPLLAATYRLFLGIILLPAMFAVSGICPGAANASTHPAVAGATRPANISDSLARARIIAGVERLRTAMEEEDVEVFVELTLPRLIEVAGGRRKFIEVYRKGMEAVHEAGLKITGYMFSDSFRLIRKGRDVYAVIPTVLVMTSPTIRRMTIESYLIAFSPNGGETWTYLNGNERFATRSELKKLLPRVPNSLKLPRKKEPVVEND